MTDKQIRGFVGHALWFIFGVLFCGAMVAMESPVDAKKKPKQDRSVVEFAIAIDPETGTGTRKHGCCDCELWHDVTTRVVVLADGRIAVVESWSRDDVMSHQERVKRFGSEYWNPMKRGDGLWPDSQFDSR